MTLAADELETIARDEAGRLYRMALGLVRNPADAEDVVQEAYLRAWRARESYRGDAPVGAWLARIVHNVAVERARRSERELAVDDVEARWADDAYTVDAAVVVERAEQRHALEEALVHIPFIYRSAVLLHDAEGYTVAEIARIHDIALDAAKARLRRGRMALVTSLAGDAERRAALDGVPLSCADARARVSDYLDDQLPADVRLALERHLAGCPTCPPLYASLVGVRDRLGRLRDPDTVVPPGLAARLAPPD